MTTTDGEHDALTKEIEELEKRLPDAKAKLNPRVPTIAPPSQPLSANNASHLHTLLLLSDSALPLGSFAFSSGLESYLAHHRPSPPSSSQIPSFQRFLDLSLSTLCTTALPYVLAAYRDPWRIGDLDNDFDASTPCTVARRASIAQGRALLGIWDRSFKPHFKSLYDRSCNEAIEALNQFQHDLRNPKDDELPSNAHLAPLWGLVTRILRLPLEDAAYLFLFSHARTLTSAAVRASVFGPYQAQAVLASAELQSKIRHLMEENWERSVEEAGQTVPVMDLWVGRHEKLYSRIFNS